MLVIVFVIQNCEVENIRLVVSKTFFTYLAFLHFSFGQNVIFSLVWEDIHANFIFIHFVIIDTQTLFYLNWTLGD